MTILVARVVHTRLVLYHARTRPAMMAKCFSTCFPCLQQAEKAEKPKETDGDPRINVLGRAIEDDYATIRENYGTFPIMQR